MFTLILNDSKMSDLVYSYILKNMNIENLKIKKDDTCIIFNYSSSDLQQISILLTDVIIYFYENNLINNILKKNYFYFTDDELNKILDTCNSILIKEDSNHKKDLIYLSILDYLKDNSTMNLDGFIQFRLKDYLEILDYLVDLAVNNFIINREYLKFIELLQDYIFSSESKIDIVHLIYLKNESILLDKYKKSIPIDDHILDAKYLSDISFSSNDYCLNTLLNILPQKLYIHILDESDEFINTLQKIFKSRAILCFDCDICNLYKNASELVHSDNLDF